MGKKIKFSFIVVTWNSQGYIARCLDSVFQQSSSAFEVILVDNGSRDNTVQVIEERYPRVRVIKNSENRGFCQANNQGIQEARGEFIVTLNSDAVLDKDFLKSVERALQGLSSKVGMLNPRILTMDKKRIDSTGLLLSPFRRFHDRGKGKKGTRIFRQGAFIFGPCAACGIYRRDLLESVSRGGEYFDSRFFFLGEDYDLAWRAKRKGWKAWYVPGAVCFHERNSSSHSPAFLQYLSFRNRYLLIAKNETLAGISMLVPSLLLYDIPRLMYLFIRNQYTLRALRELRTLIPEIVRERGLSPAE